MWFSFGLSHLTSAELFFSSEYICWWKMRHQAEICLSTAAWASPQAGIHELTIRLWMGLAACPNLRWNCIPSRIERTKCHIFQWQFVCSIRDECQFMASVNAFTSWNVCLWFGFTFSVRVSVTSSHVVIFWTEMQVGRGKPQRHSHIIQRGWVKKRERDLFVLEKRNNEFLVQLLLLLLQLLLLIFTRCFWVRSVLHEPSGHNGTPLDTRVYFPRMWEKGLCLRS